MNDADIPKAEASPKPVLIAGFDGYCVYSNPNLSPRTVQLRDNNGDIKVIALDVFEIHIANRT